MLMTICPLFQTIADCKVLWRLTVLHSHGIFSLRLPFFYTFRLPAVSCYIPCILLLLLFRTCSQFLHFVYLRRKFWQYLFAPLQDLLLLFFFIIFYHYLLLQSTLSCHVLLNQFWIWKQIPISKSRNIFKWIWRGNVTTI